MRFSPLVLMLGLATSAVSIPAAGQRPDDQIAPQSVALKKQGESLYSQGKLVEADDAFETALVVDPKNRAAFVAMARVAIKQKLYGQAIKQTNKALSLEPTDRSALQVQGEAMVELGALPRARENLAKLEKLCAQGCPEKTALSTAISRGPAMAAVKPATGTKNN